MIIHFLPMNKLRFKFCIEGLTLTFKFNLSFMSVYSIIAYIFSECLSRGVGLAGLGELMTE